MIHKNIPKSPTQHLTYQPRHLVDVKKPEGDRDMGRESEQVREREKKRERQQVPQASDKKSKKWTALNGFSTLY